jgi:serine/threonine protein kinase
VEGRHYASRYAIVYETLVGRRGDEQAIALRLLTRPSNLGFLRTLEEELSAQLSYWASISDHENIVQVWDWGIQPQPWLATSYVDGTLVSYPQPSVANGLRMAVSLAEAVTHMHQHDVVHGGIDPRNVVFPGDPFEDNPDDIPMIDNIGLPSLYMNEDSAGDYVDPRFQAPEQYSDEYGRMDHSTDIYQLGATLFYVLTGHPPFRGDQSTIRTAVLAGEFPDASAIVDAVPETVDEIIRKAMATQKMRRYETVDQLFRDLQRAAESYTGE